MDPNFEFTVENATLTAEIEICLLTYLKSELKNNDSYSVSALFLYTLSAMAQRSHLNDS